MLEKHQITNLLMEVRSCSQQLACHDTQIFVDVYRDIETELLVSLSLPLPVSREETMLSKQEIFKMLKENGWTSSHLAADDMNSFLAVFEVIKEPFLASLVLPTQPEPGPKEDTTHDAAVLLQRDDVVRVMNGIDRLRDKARLLRVKDSTAHLLDSTSRNLFQLLSILEWP